MDNSRSICQEYDIVYLKSSATMRAAQMNEGARFGSGDILAFLHADVRPCEEIENAISDHVGKGYEAGLFSYRFDRDHPLLKINSFFTKRNGLFTGGGDQLQFVKREVFERLNGYNEDQVIMEDFEFYNRWKAEGIKYDTVDNPCIVSARKYENNSYLKVNFINLIAFLKFKRGADPRDIQKFYTHWIQ